MGCEWSAEKIRSEVIGCEESSEALIALARMSSYESSVNDPIDVALANSLRQRGDFRVGRYYMFDRDTERALQNLKAPEFVIPQMVPLNSAQKIYFSIRNWTELIRVVRNLKRMGISPHSSKRNRIPNAYPLLIGISPTEAVPKLASEIFDEVIPLNEALGFQRISSNAPGLCLLPESPLTPTTEVANYRTRMIFRRMSPLPVNESESGRGPGPGPELVSVDGLIETALKAIRSGGLRELQFENLVALRGELDIGAFLERVTKDLDISRMSVSLLGVNPGQINKNTVAIMARFSRVRIEIDIPALSALAAKRLSLTYSPDQLKSALACLDRKAIKSISLKVQLGVSEDHNDEVAETIAEINALRTFISTQRGIKFRITPSISQTEDKRGSASLVGPDIFHESFEKIKRECRIKGVAFFIGSVYERYVNALILRGAWSNLAEFSEFCEIEETLDIKEICSSKSEFLKAQSIDTFRNPVTGNSGSIERSDQSAGENFVSLSLPKSQTTPAPISPEAQPQGIKSHSSFGRGRKKTITRQDTEKVSGKIRFTWGRVGLARFLSHLDNLRALEAAIMRINLPVSYTRGMRPRLRLSFGPPLPVGFSSECELLDITLESQVCTDTLREFTKALPPEFFVLGSQPIGLRGESILSLVKEANYLIELPPDTDIQKLERTLAERELWIQRKTKTKTTEINLRPLIKSAVIENGRPSEWFSAEPGAHTLRLTVALTERSYVRPEEFLKVSGLVERSRIPSIRIHRLSLRL